MKFEDKFLELANPFFNLQELPDDVAEDVLERYYEFEELIEPLKAKLAELAKGEPNALDSLATFFKDERATEFLNHPYVEPFLKVLSLASNITADTWSEEVSIIESLQPLFLNDQERIEQSYSASGTPLTYFFHNNDEVTNSVALIDFRSSPTPTELRSPETWTTLGKDLVEACTVIFLLENISKVDSCVAVISSEQDPEKAVSYLKYHLVMRGNTLTLPVPLNDSTDMQDIQQRITTGTDFTQFAEPLAMLGEINSRSGLLDTFLSTYHVLENYMIRSKVSAVLSTSQGRRFQRVRDFKRLGQQTDANEMNHLTSLFDSSWEIQLGNSSLQQTLQESFDNIKADSDWDESMFNEFLEQLRILNRRGEPVTLTSGFNVNDLSSMQKNFVKLVYSIRCSIVHNKATEFHLSNEELRRKSIRALVIAKLCLPVMFRLAFGLPSSSPETNPIHYQIRELMFY